MIHSKRKIKLNRSIFYLCLAVIMTISFVYSNVYAEENAEQNTFGKIDAMIKETMEKSKIPVSSTAVVQNQEVQYSSYKTANNNNYTSDEFSLFQIGSMTKAYTGLAVLLLEDEGKLSLNDPVAEYIPWLTFTYQDKPIKNEDLTIGNLLYQTSGLTNDETVYPKADIGMSLEESIKRISGLELASYPNVRYAYANANFNILGLIIENVSGQSYEEFMTQKLLIPLGLTNTYISHDKAQKSGKMTSATKLSFLHTQPFNIPVANASVPAGYFISNASDMGRWLQIQMGVIEVSPQFTRLIEKSHIPNEKSVVDTNTLYAAGWFVDKANSLIYHSSGTANYSAKITMAPKDLVAACVLTNINSSANTNDLADNIVKILQGKPINDWHPDIWLIFDRIFTVVTIASISLILMLAIYFIIFLKQCKDGKRQWGKRSKRNIAFITASVLMVLLSITEIIVVPVIFQSGWVDLAIWAPYSVIWGTISFALLSLLLLAVSSIVGKYRRRMYS